VSDELNPRFSFETFVVGAGNRLAVTAARTVAQSPGAAYNPLYLYSPTGLGKTHLLTAVGQLAKEHSPDLHVEYLTLDEFVEAYHAAVAAGQSEAFRNRFDRVDVLLVDDVQFLTHRREMQAELLRVTGQLQSAGKQIVLTSDCPPSEIEDLDERLLSRFDGGLVADIGAPDYETRLAILKRRAEDRDAEFDEEVLGAVASFDLPNVRELLGLLNRLVAYQAVSESPLTPAGAKELLAGDAERAKAAAERPPPAPPAAPAPVARPEDEFADFLSDVAHTVEEQVEAWRSRLGEAILLWEAEGYRTVRLEEMLQQDIPVPAERVVQQFERDVERLRSSQAAIAKMDPGRADDPLFFDPDRVEEANELVQQALVDTGPPPGPSAAWSLDTYVVGEANKVALNAARAVADRPGQRYNPLVLVGPTGVGKTHLMHAIGHRLGAAADAVVACLTAQQLLDELVEAIEGERVDIWRARYRRVTAFLLDDVHILARKERSQEELFHLFNELHDAGHQLVFTAVTSPREIEGLDDRLKSRLEGGLVTTMAGPDRELRRNIVARKMDELFRGVDDELIDYIAARPADSIRAVLGLIQRVAIAAEAQEVAPSAALARELIEGAAPERARTGVRTSGVLLSPSGNVRSREKLVWSWPDPVERVIEALV
jgi:chromosomal replication initiator protein DnaA